MSWNAAKRALSAESMKGVHVAIQGVGSVGGGLARLLAQDGARLTLADVNADKAAELAEELGAETAAAESKVNLLKVRSDYAVSLVRLNISIGKPVN